MAAKRAPSFIDLCCGEPFRVFFPLGLLIGISGVSLWPLFFSGIHKFHPGVMHARMMIEGFMGAFILGFLGTAGPRLLGSPALSRVALGTLVTLLLAAVAFHIAHAHVVGDAIFLLLLLAFAAAMFRRFRVREDLPPPAFVLVLCGFLSAVFGTVLLLMDGGAGRAPRAALLGSQLLYQGFVLHLVLGVGAFLLPRFLGLPRVEFQESRKPDRAWSDAAVAALVVGAILLATFVVEAFTDATRRAAVIRFVAAAIFLLVQVRFHQRAIPWMTVTVALRLSIVFLLLGLLFPAIWPGQRVAGAHLTFIGGFTLIVFAVATRVVFGHSGLSALFPTRMPFLIVTVALLVAAAALRVVGDFLPGSRSTLLDAASYAWMIGAAIWAGAVLPKVRIPDPEG